MECEARQLASMTLEYPHISFADAAEIACIEVGDMLRCSRSHPKSKARSVAPKDVALYKEAKALQHKKPGLGIIEAAAQVKDRYRQDV